VVSIGFLVFYKMSQDRRQTTFAVVKEKCPEFKKGGCPYTKLVPQLKGMQRKCPAFKDGKCPFRDIDGKKVDDVIKKMAEMKAKCPGKEQYTKAIKAIVAFSLGAEMGKCPFFKDGCIFGAALTMGELKEGCAGFKGCCPYQDLPKEIMALAKGCPAFKDGCPYQKCQSVDELLDKMAQMKAQCKAKEEYTKALKAFAELSQAKEKEVGKCPFYAHGCIFKDVV